MQGLGGTDTLRGFAPSDAERIDLSRLDGIELFADLRRNHLDMAGGALRIVTGQGIAVLAGDTLADAAEGGPLREGDVLIWHRALAHAPLRVRPHPCGGVVPRGSH